MSAASSTTSASKLGTFVALEGQPVGDGLFQLLPLGANGLVTDVVDGGLVGGNHARLGAELDGHVAHRHAPFHGEPSMASPANSTT